MIFRETPLAGAYVIDLEKRGDDRGFFARAFCSQEFAEHGLATEFVQVNNSLSGEQGTLRGMHYQLPPDAETKVVRCIRGAVWDCILDLRRDSPTFGRWFGETLSAENRRMMYVPKGIAHGFITLEPYAEVFYFVDAFYVPASERGVRWNDPQFAIEWPAVPRVISDKDATARDFDPVWHLAATSQWERAMKILFTGASSFTGYWFVKQLAERGHEVWATFTKPAVEDYADQLRRERAERVVQTASPVFGCRFGDDVFLHTLRDQRFDLLCHHGADVTNYRSADFNVDAAVASNTHDAAAVVAELAASGAALIVTGSIFELGEGAGSDGLPAFSPYGQSKAITWQVLSEHATAGGIGLAKFVIPNPFGPWEELRFTAHLLRTWARGEAATVRTPAYVRDNIHVSLLAQAYVALCEELHAMGNVRHANPSGYVESQGEFAERVAREVRGRTGWECRLEWAEQTEFEEPRVRTNTEPSAEKCVSWSEAASWDEFVDWYRRRLKE